MLKGSVNSTVNGLQLLLLLVYGVDPLVDCPQVILDERVAHFHLVGQLGR